MDGNEAVDVCALCGAPSPRHELAEAAWLGPEAVERMLRWDPNWQRPDGACPACAQEALLEALMEHGEAALHEGIQAMWPLDAEAAFGALPTPLRLHADPRYTGKGVTLALIDAGFYPHPDLVQPRNRIRAWVDASRDPVHEMRFEPDDPPHWPGWDDGHFSKWHGLMTSTVAAGNGRLSHGLYSGMACDVELVLIQVRDADGHITNDSIARALRWVHTRGWGLGIRVVSMSVAGDAVDRLARNPVDETIAALVADNIVVVAAAGNSGERRLVPPASAPEALTIGGLDDKNTFTHEEREIWHSNYGEGDSDLPKPELVAPSIWVVAPVLPGTEVAAEAAQLFARRAQSDPGCEGRLAELKLVTPYYQHVEGTSFAAPIVAGVVACLLQANPRLTPAQVRAALIATAQFVPGASAARQGAGAVDPGRCIARVLDELGPAAGPPANGAGG